MPSKKKDIPWTLRQLCVKIGVMFATVTVGLWCGRRDSFSAFYVAVLVQAVNNAYESYGLMSGYNRFITGFHILSFLGAIVSAVAAVLYFAGAAVGVPQCMYAVVVLLSVPILHFFIEAICLFVNGTY